MWRLCTSSMEWKELSFPHEIINLHPPGTIVVSGCLLNEFIYCKTSTPSKHVYVVTITPTTQKQTNHTTHPHNTQHTTTHNTYTTYIHKTHIYTTHNTHTHTNNTQHTPTQLHNNTTHNTHTQTTHNTPTQLHNNTAHTHTTHPPRLSRYYIEKDEWELVTESLNLAQPDVIFSWEGSLFAITSEGITKFNFTKKVWNSFLKWPPMSTPPYTFVVAFQPQDS